MARQKVKIYRKRRPLRTFLRLFGILVAAAAILLVGSFFWLQNFIVYTTEGIRIDAPFLRNFTEEIPASSILPYPIAPTPQPTYTPPPTIETEELPPGVYERVLHVNNTQLDAILDWEHTLYSFSATGVMIPLNTTSGELWWETDISLAHSYLLAGDGRIDLIVDQIPNEIRRSALLHTFYNTYMAQRNQPAALSETWLDPENVEIQNYIIDQAVELVALGFHEIVLQDFFLPTGEALPQNHEAILAFLSRLSGRLAQVDASLSVFVPEAFWIVDEGLNPNLLANSIARFYTQLDLETVQNETRFLVLYNRISHILGEDSNRFIPFAPGVMLDGNWLIVQ